MTEIKVEQKLKHLEGELLKLSHCFAEHSENVDSALTLHIATMRLQRLSTVAHLVALQSDLVGRLNIVCNIALKAVPEKMLEQVGATAQQQLSALPSIAAMITKNLADLQAQEAQADDAKRRR